MKLLFNKIVQVSATIVISCIVVYGIVYAQQVCCNDMETICMPASSKVFGDYTSNNSWTNPQSYGRINQLRSNLCSKNILTDFGPGNECCETERCDGYKQTTFFSLSSIQDLIALSKITYTFDADDGAQTSFESNSLSTSHYPVPIYILKQSIIC